MHHTGCRAVQARLETQRTQSLAHCTPCHSGGLDGTWACVNGDCRAWFRVHDAHSRLGAVQTALRRLDW